ncbi:F-box protein, partial [Acinetobacter baumannii]
SLASLPEDLPEDVLLLIFLSTEPGAELALCQVSRYWRHLALTTPRLWTIIRLNDFSWAKYGLGKDVRGLDETLRGQYANWVKLYT